jgi:hypothetical protein
VYLSWLMRVSDTVLTCEALIASWVVGGAIDRAAFDIYIETQLAPALVPGTVLILNRVGDSCCQCCTDRA